MSITSERIREQPFFHALADDAAEEIETLEKELDQLRAENELLKANLTRSTTRVELLENAIDNAMVVSHIGVFNSGDNPYIAINKLACHEQDVGAFFAIEKIKEQGPICYWDGCYSDPYFRANHNAPGIGKDGIPLYKLD